MKRSQTIAALAASAVLLTASPAVAKRGSDRPQRFEGPIAAVDADSVTIGTTEIALSSSTRYSAPKRLVRTAADLRVGDWVKVEKRGAAAKRVQLKLLSFEGVATDATADDLVLEVDDANKPGDAFLDGDDSVEVAYTDDTRFDDDLVPLDGDEVEVTARVAADGTGLEAVSVEVEEDGDDDEDDSPTTTSTSTTSTTVAP